MKREQINKVFRNLLSLKLYDVLNDFLSYTVQDFAAKVRWRKEHDRNPLLITLQDKYKVREFARSKGIKTPKLFLTTENAESIAFEQLPREYFIKANHASGWNIRCIDSKLYLYRDGQDFAEPNAPSLPATPPREHLLTREQCVSLCKNWLSKKYVRKEWAYQWITPKILVEEVLIPREGDELKDYRFYTFHGLVKAINVGSPIYRRNKENVFFKPNWRRFKLTRYDEKLPHPIPKKPYHLQEMIQAAQSLGKDIDFVRVDLYDTIHGVVLGEMTIYPDGGKKPSPTACPFFNWWLGAQWDLKP